MGERVDHAVVGDQVEWTELGVDDGAVFGFNAFYESFSLEAVVDDLLYGADFEVVFLGKYFEIGEARHFAIILTNLAYEGARADSGEFHEVYGPLGLAGADEDAACAGAEGNHVAGPGEVIGTGIGVGDDLDGFCSIRGGNACCYAVFGVSVYRDGHGCSAERCVEIGLGVEVEAVAFGAGKGDAEVARGVFDHKIDDFGCYELRSADEIALVFTIFIIYEDDHFALFEVAYDVFKWCELAHGRGS